MIRLTALLLMLLLVAPGAAQTPGQRVYRLAELAPSDVSLQITRAETLPELAKLGFQEGRNLIVDERVGDRAAMAGLAGQLLAPKPDAVIAIGIDAIRAVAEATKTVPIVAFGADPVRAGFASNFSHPGGNVTGVVILAEALDGKRLDLLHATVPAAHRIAALVQSSLSYRRFIEEQLRSVAVSSGIEVTFFEAEGPSDYQKAFDGIRAAGAQALVITGSPTFNRDAELLARQALEMHLPVMCEWAENAQSGCLLGYGPNRRELRRRVAHMLVRIFEGHAPGDLPIETPTYFELAINLKTARALGLEVPTSLLARADKVIE